MSAKELVFVALGGLGEIGMNAALYGLRNGRKTEWLLVDLGIAFPGEEMPGVDVVMPDIRFIEAEKRSLAGIIITHAHEDHFGALAELWPRLGAPVYMTRFAADLLEARRLGEPGAPQIPVRVVPTNARFEVGSFKIEMIPVAHSIPESTALAIRTPLGAILHSGDWKIDETPVVGHRTDVARLKEIGQEGVLALVSDSTNVMRDGISPSEAEVAATLAEIVAGAKGRVAVTTFASNVARMRAVAEAAQKADREIVVVGRAMERVVDVARELGFLEGLPPFRDAEAFRTLPRNRVVALLTGSQGEPRAALARVAAGEHPEISLHSGDTVIFSSRTIPGNEKPVGAIMNNLARLGVTIITDRTALVHVSGHPRRTEMADLYTWLKPRIAVPAHGEAMHLSEHVAFARSCGVPEVIRAFNGEMVRFAPGEAAIIDEVPVGRLCKDGDMLLDGLAPAIADRRRLGFAGIISVALAIDERGAMVGDLEITYSGIPDRDASGKSSLDLIEKTIDEAFASLPKAKRRDPDVVRTAIERSLRSSLRAAWGKKPMAHVMVIEV